MPRQRQMDVRVIQRIDELAASARQQ